MMIGDFSSGLLAVSLYLPSVLVVGRLWNLMPPPLLCQSGRTVEQVPSESIPRTKTQEVRLLHGRNDLRTRKATHHGR